MEFEVCERLPRYDLRGNLDLLCGLQSLTSIKFAAVQIIRPCVSKADCLKVGLHSAGEAISSPESETPDPIDDH